MGKGRAEDGILAQSVLSLEEEMELGLWRLFHPIPS